MTCRDQAFEFFSKQTIMEGTRVGLRVEGFMAMKFKQAINAMDAYEMSRTGIQILSEANKNNGASLLRLNDPETGIHCSAVGGSPHKLPDGRSNCRRIFRNRVGCTI